MTQVYPQQLDMLIEKCYSESHICFWSVVFQTFSMDLKYKIYRVTEIQTRSGLTSQNNTTVFFLRDQDSEQHSTVTCEEEVYLCS